MKITPMILFLIILIVLVISIVIGNQFMNTEGFIAFQYSKQPADNVAVTCYSSTRQVTKIEDNLYFDQTNGNLIELDGTAYTTAADSTGATLKAMVVLPRVGNELMMYAIDTSNGTKPLVQDTDTSKISTLASSYSSRIYPIVSKTAQPATILYVPWKLDTYIIPVFTGTSMNSISISNMYLFSSGSNVIPSSITSSAIPLTGYYADTDASNNSIVVDKLYDASRSIYQISSYVKFDIRNANLIIKNGDGTLSVYDRYKNKVTTPVSSASNPTTVANTGFSPWTTFDSSGQNIVMYMPNGQNTVIALAGFSDTTKSSLTLRNVTRFNTTGLDTSSTNNSKGTCDLVNHAYYDASSCKAGGCNWDYTGSGYCTKNTPLQPSPLGNSGNKGNQSNQCNKSYNFDGSGGLDLSKLGDNAISDYFKWYWYWKSGAGSPGKDTSDYILKTQIVPPVCPTCPSCQNSSSGTCTNCGGKGGSGTMTSSGISIFDACGNPTTCAKLGPNGVGYDANKNKILCYQNGQGSSSVSKGSNSVSKGSSSAVTGSASNQNANQGRYGSNGAGGVVNNAISTTGGVIGGTAMGAEAVVGGTVLGAGLLANKTIDTTSGLLTGAGTGATNLLTSAGTGATNLLKSAGTGVSNLLTPGQGGYGQNGTYGQGGTYGQSGYGPGNNQRSTYYGTQNQYNDQYSYYGQLPSKGASNYMPITTDFSAFGK